jgi:hypothetical protein
MQSQPAEDTPAWFALRATVFAAGYRSLLAKDCSISFAKAQAKAGQLFKSALSVFTKLLLPPSSIMAVRALTLMVCSISLLGLGNDLMILLADL